MAQRAATRPRSPPRVASGLEVLRWAHGGEGVASPKEGPEAGKVVFVPGVVPGDVVSVALVEDKGRWARGRLVAIERPSPERVAIPCPVQARCGGCPWMPGSASAQAESRRAILIGELAKRLGVAESSLDGPIAFYESARRFGYRRRLRLGFEVIDGQVALGFFAKQSHALVDVARCAIADDAINDALPALRAELARLGAERDRSGRVTLVAGTDGVAGWIEPRHGAGVAFLRERVTTTVDGAAVEVSPRAFLQANAEVTERMVAVLRDWAAAARAEYAGDPWAVELYAGGGALTRALWQAGWRVQAYELGDAARPAFEALREAAGVPPERGPWHGCDLGVGLPLPPPPAPSLIVLDPPRTGAAAVMPWVRSAGARHVIYVSCDLATGLRDLAALVGGGGYRIARMAALDMFPHSGHQEVMFLLAAGS